MTETPRRMQVMSVTFPDDRNGWSGWGWPFEVEASDTDTLALCREALELLLRIRRRLVARYRPLWGPEESHFHRYRAYLSDTFEALVHDTLLSLSSVGHQWRAASAAEGFCECGWPSEDETLRLTTPALWQEHAEGEARKP